MASSMQQASGRGMEAAETALLSLQSKTAEALQQSVLTRHLVCIQMHSYLQRLQLDLSQLRVVHVAGTKGKGSTCAFAESVLRRCGLSTGLFTSPHLIHVTERFKLDGRTISDELYLRHFWAVWDKLHATASEAGDDPPVPSFFRFLTLVAFHLFCAEKPDVVVLEVGMGGRLDSTNVVAAPLVCGIASIGYDHMEVLGDTLTLIAREKAGIMKPGALTLTIPQADEVAVALKQCAEEESSTLRTVPALPSDVVLGLDGEHQRENAALAVGLCQRAFETLDGTDEAETKRLRGLARAVAAGELPAEVLDGLRSTRWPGRCQTYVDAEQSNLTYFVDGAHTDASMAVACAWFAQQLDSTPTDPSLAPSAHTAALNSADDGDELSLAPSPSLSAAAPAQPSYNILLFNTGHVRNPFDLLQPVVSLGVHTPAAQFGHMLSCPFDHDRPHLQRTPQFTALAAQQSKEVQAAAAAELPAPAPGGLTWQHTLFRVFDTLVAYNARRQQSSPPAVASSLAIPSAGASVVRYPHRFVYAQSSAQAVFLARGLARRHPHVRFRVFVCGSLYLVGNVLDKLGYRIT